MINFSEILWTPRRRSDPAVRTVRSEPKVAPEPAGIRPEVRPEVRVIPKVEAHLGEDNRLIASTDPRSPGADSFRMLRMRLWELRGVAPVKSILITSPEPQDGKSTTSLNLAATLAEGGKRRVLLVDADLHRSSLTGALNIPPVPGLAECLEKNADPMDFVQEITPLHFCLLQAGQAAEPDLLQSALLPSKIRILTDYFDWVLFDSPPVNALVDAVYLAQYADTALLVVRADRTPRASTDRALDALGRKNVLAILFNGADDAKSRYSYYAQRPR